MARLLIPIPYRYYTDGESELEVRGLSVALAVEELLERYPALEPHLINSQGNLHPFIHLFVNDRQIEELQEMNIPLQPDDILRIVPSIAGGSTASV